MVVAGKLSQAFTAYSVCQVARLANLGESVASAVQNKRRHAYRGKRRAHVDFSVHSHNFHGHAGARGLPEVVRECLPGFGIGRLAGGEYVDCCRATPFPLQALKKCAPFLRRLAVGMVRPAQAVSD